ncbi:hypothetical protein C457_17838 [Haloferax prahovense DSM 18310]|uniref:Uncharacterized protein n=4 Tax=Halobacteriales TaxID=2235 RepID=M0FY72_HALPT|nr:hypothetical protein C457_17838 [Haloferax prahovense DSM 18310]
MYLDLVRATMTSRPVELEPESTGIDRAHIHDLDATTAGAVGNEHVQSSLLCEPFVIVFEDSESAFGAITTVQHRGFDFDRAAVRRSGVVPTPVVGVEAVAPLRRFLRESAISCRLSRAIHNFA